VSILQKSRVQLHDAEPYTGHRTLKCQSFRNQGFSYTSGFFQSRSGRGSVSILQKSRVQLHVVPVRTVVVVDSVSILQKSRVQLHDISITGGGIEFVVSILQKSRVQLH